MSRPLDPIPMPYVDPEKKKEEEAKDTVIPYEERGCDDHIQGASDILTGFKISNKQNLIILQIRRGTAPRR